MATLQDAGAQIARGGINDLQKPRAIQVALQNLDSAICRLKSTVDILENRLQPALPASPPAEGIKGNLPIPAVCEIEAMILEYTGVVEHCVRRLQAIETEVQI